MTSQLFALSPYLASSTENTPYWTAWFHNMPFKCGEEFHLTESICSQQICNAQMGSDRDTVGDNPTGW